MISDAHIDSIPNEVLEYIFKVGAHQPMLVDNDYPRQPLFSKLRLAALYPANISQVCIRWRVLALQMPVLWSFIYLTRSSTSHKRLKSQLGRSLEWVETYLQRAAAIPLHITLDSTRLPAAALNLLLPHNFRWQSLVLLVSHVGNLPAILPLIRQTDAPHLRSLTIASDIYREGIISYDPMPPFLIPATPELSTIRLIGTYIAWNAPPLLHLHELELHFSSRWPPFQRLQEMFDASPNLRRLVVHDEIATILRNVEQPPTKETIGLMSLRHLEIQVHRIRDAHADVASLMGLFNMPILETLTLKGLKDEEWEDIARKFGLPLDPMDLETRGPRSRRYGEVFNAFPFLASLIVR